MRLLELFSGTQSVGKVARKLGYDVVSLDLKNADIETDILKWNYREIPKKSFDIIFASPPCDTFSNLKCCNIGRKLKRHNGQILTRELIQQDIDNVGLPILRKTEEIIKYFNPTLWYIENPKTGRMKDYILDRPYYDVDYCKYSDWGYKKSTRIWTNLEGFEPKICKKDCGNMNGNKHISNIGGKTLGNVSNISLKYRIPPKLIYELIPNI